MLTFALKNINKRSQTPVSEGGQNRSDLETGSVGGMLSFAHSFMQSVSICLAGVCSGQALL